MSARYVGIKIGKTTKEVYDIWEDMGLVVRDKWGDWGLTDAGRSIGGKMSKSNYRPVPTFDLNVVEEKMNEFCNKNPEE